jgi:hypothetical protein
MADEQSTGTQAKAKEPARGAGKSRRAAQEESEAQGMEFEELEPRPPTPSLNPVGADVSAVEVFYYDEADEVDPVTVNLVADIDYEADEVDNFDAELVTSLQSAGGPGGVVVAINGVAYAFGRDQAGVLVRQVQRAVSAT